MFMMNWFLITSWYEIKKRWKKFVLTGKLPATYLLLYYFGITIDGSNFVPYQCTFNGASDTWSGEWYEINLDSTGQTISVGTDTGNGVVNEVGNVSL